MYVLGAVVCAFAVLTPALASVAALLQTVQTVQTPQLQMPHLVVENTVLLNPESPNEPWSVNLNLPGPQTVGFVYLTQSPAGCNGYDPVNGACTCQNPPGLYDCTIFSVTPASAEGSFVMVATQKVPVNYPAGQTTTSVCEVKTTSTLNPANFAGNGNSVQIGITVIMDDLTNGQAPAWVNKAGGIALLYGTAVYNVEVIPKAEPSSSCSAPPPSVEVCLTSIFNSIDSNLLSMITTMSQHESSIHSEMRHEHTLLHSEVSHVGVVKSVANSVKEHVAAEYTYIELQIKNLQLEQQEVKSAYAKVKLDLNGLEGYVKQVQFEEQRIINQVNQVKMAKWDLYSDFSVIVYEKEALSEAEEEVEKVVEVLSRQIDIIYAKLAELNKRQVWLVSWEDKLYVEIENFEKDVVAFKDVQAALHAQQAGLEIQQEALLEAVEHVQTCLEILYMEEETIEDVIENLQDYQKELVSLQFSVSLEVSVFYGAYDQFTCEDSLLYYEACTSKAVPVPAAP